MATQQATSNDGTDSAGHDEVQQAAARHSYNRMSRVYSMLSDSSEKRFVRDAIDAMLKPAVGETILEPGFGTGQALVALAELVGAEGKVCGVDISDKMLEHTKRRVEEHDLAGRVELVRGSATALPWPDSHFDAAFMSFTLELFADDEIPVVLAEAARVLRGDGRLCIAAMSSVGGMKAMEELYGWSHRHFPSFVDCRPIDASAAVVEAGFTITESRQLSMWGLAVELILATPPE